MIRFAFYGRVSTEDQQDPESSMGWQRSRATALIAPRDGQIVRDYFDIGQSRSVPWSRRPRAADLLTALADRDRGFDAVVVGEPQRAFYGNQFGLTFPVFDHYAVPLWVPEVGGPIDPNNEAHDLIMSVFGGMSKGERMRIKVRVRSAMAAQAKVEGRYLGGRPPYGYRLADAGPHPNPAKAADGKRLHVLEHHPETAPIVERIFREFTGGKGIFAIAEGLTADGIPSPSAHDRKRNSHRSGIAWGKSAVRAILLNPRYTGRQVWNKQRKDEVLIDVKDVGQGHTTKLRWNGKDDWVWSERITHPPIVNEDMFRKAAKVIESQSRTASNPHSPPRSRHPYQLRGLMRCGICKRRMQGTMNNGKPHYRCGFPAEYGTANAMNHPRNVYLREDRVVPKLDLWVATAFSPSRLSATLRAMLAEQDRPVDLRHVEVARQAREAVADCDRKLAQYRSALDAGADPAVVTGWITETQAARAAAIKRSKTTGPAVRAVSEEELAALVAELGDIAVVLGDADPADKARLYAQIGLNLVYDFRARRVAAFVQLNHGVQVVSEGGHAPNSMALGHEFDVDAA